jgi:hypothetical protein
MIARDPGGRLGLDFSELPDFWCCDLQRDDCSDGWRATVVCGHGAYEATIPSTAFMVAATRGTGKVVDVVRGAFALATARAAVGAGFVR